MFLGGSASLRSCRNSASALGHARRGPMDTERFDRWVRTLTAPRSRRGALTGLLGGGLSLLGVAGTTAKHHKKKHKKKPKCPASCPVCQQCVDGRSCTFQANATPCGNLACQECRGGACTNLADDAGCNGNGRCLAGTCNPPPNCSSFTTLCTA